MSDASLSAEDRIIISGDEESRANFCEDCGEPLDSVEREADRGICFACYSLQQS